jgi:hypothetical protein
VKTFKQAWAEKEAAGYRYGRDALEGVRFGWDMACADRDEQIRVLREAMAGAEAHLLIGLDLNEAGLNGRAHQALLGIREALAATEPKP